jgi:hypothetical protein
MNSKKIMRTEQLIAIHTHKDAENCKIPKAENLNINILLQTTEHGGN